jgi:hypothetical protein
LIENSLLNENRQSFFPVRYAAAKATRTPYSSFVISGADPESISSENLLLDAGSWSGMITNIAGPLIKKVDLNP